MRVLITVPVLSLPGGVANYYRVLQPYLTGKHAYCEVGARSDRETRWRSALRLLRDLWRFHRRLSAESFDLVHLNPSLGWRALIRDGLLLLIAKGHDRRVLVFFRGWDPEVERRVRQRFARLFRRVYGRADAFVVLAREFREALSSLGIGRPVYLETTVIPDELLKAVPAAATHDCGSSPVRLLYLSRLDRQKGLPETLAAFALLSTRHPGVELIIAGDGPERSAAEERVRREGLSGVRFAGHLEGDAKWLAFADADVFVFPTFFGEGMPNAVLEAMAAGLPVVTRPVGGVKDFFEHGRMGFLVPDGDPGRLADCLETLVRDPRLRREIGEFNCNYARNRFAAPHVAKRLQDIYARVVTGD